MGAVAFIHVRSKTNLPSAFFFYIFTTIVVNVLIKYKNNF